MTIILISTKTLIKKKKERELRREDCVQTLWNIFGTFQVYLEVIISCAKKNAAISSWKQVAGVLQHLPQL